MTKIALIGCGFIGGFLSKALQKNGSELVGVFDIDQSHCRKVCKNLKRKPKIARNLTELLSLEPDLVVEAASQKAVKQYAGKVLKSGYSFLAMSVGALLDETFYKKLQMTAEKNNVQLIVPSGAVGGLEVLRSASIGKIISVVLTTTKRAKTLGFEKLKETKVVFDGSAIDVVKKFPKNTNVAAAVSLAGLGGKKTRVRVVADPNAVRNSHEVVAKGEFGSLVCKVENVPSDNPKTSLLAALSVVESVKGFQN